MDVARIYCLHWFVFFHQSNKSFEILNWDSTLKGSGLKNNVMGVFYQWSNLLSDFAIDLWNDECDFSGKPTKTDVALNF